MARVFAEAELPHWRATQDTRDRLDLVTEHVPVAARRLRADRTVYHPGDTGGAHYNVGCDQVFVVLEGSGLMHAGEAVFRLGAEMAAAVAEGEVHWLENDTDADFVFVELWAPPPAETVWVDAADTARGDGVPEFTARVVEDVAFSGIAVSGLVARVAELGPGGQMELAGEGETMTYVIAGRGSSALGALEPESLVWLDPGDALELEAGPGGLRLLVAHAR